jgi:putative ABC transport system substrate-binding protein
MQFDRLRRREFIALLGGATAAWPRSARAQQPAMPVIGFLRSTSRNDSEWLIKAFRQGLAQSGFIEGTNIVIEYRWADNQLGRLPELAADLVRMNVAVIVTNQVSVRVVMAATTTIPVFFVIGGDPVQLGFVASLNRPSGNVTGLTFLAETLEAKQIEVLHEMIPNVGTIAALVHPNNPNAKGIAQAFQESGRAMQVDVDVVSVANEPDLEPAFARIVNKRAGAVVVSGDAFLIAQRHRLVALAAQFGLPTSYPDREFVVDGGLVSYGPSQTEGYRQAGILVGRIVKGDKPADLPVQQSTRVELAINLKTARALGLTFPITLLGRADEVIE